MNRFIAMLFFALTVGICYSQKILISVDMEGVAGVVTGEQLGPSGFEYQRFRKFMTDEALAAIDGAFEAGAKEIVVADAHGNGQNLLIEKLPDDVVLIRSWPRRFGMVAGIDESFDGVMLLGYHSSTHNMKGVRAHTFSSAKLTSVKVNGISLSEGMWAAMVTGHFNVPIILVTGDDIATSEVKEFLGNVEVAMVKEALGFHSAKTKTPAAAVEIIKAASANAVKRIKSFKPYKLDPKPVTLDVSFKNYRPSEVSDFFVFLMEYNSALAP
jgi:D-amino peptidase